MAVGWAQPQVGVDHAVLWDEGGAIQDLGTPGGTFAEAHDINDAGVVVGYGNAAGAYRAFRWTAATGMEELPSPGGGMAWANAVDSAGRIVGAMSFSPDPSSPTYAVLWDTSGAVIELDPLRTTASEATAITDNGVIVGRRDGRVFAWDPDTHTLFDVGAGNPQTSTRTAGSSAGHPRSRTGPPRGSSSSNPGPTHWSSN